MALCHRLMACPKCGKPVWEEIEVDLGYQRARCECGYEWYDDLSRRDDDEDECTVHTEEESHAFYNTDWFPHTFHRDPDCFRRSLALEASSGRSPKDQPKELAEEADAHSKSVQLGRGAAERLFRSTALRPHLNVLMEFHGDGGDKDRHYRWLAQADERDIMGYLRRRGYVGDAEMDDSVANAKQER